MKRVYNFSAGPAMLPEEVLKECAEEMLDYKGSGMSVMEMSHRSSLYQKILDEAEADLRDLLSVPDGYKILFLQGGASLQFSMIPMNLKKNGVFDYILTGNWAKKAYEEGAKCGKAKVIASSADRNFSYIPDLTELHVSEDADYVYLCENNTLYGTKIKTLPDTKGKPLISDVSSCFLSEPVDITKYGILFGGVQKNIGPAGVTIVIIREDLIKKDLSDTIPTMMSYKVHADHASLYNTPPAYGIYVSGKVIRVKDINEIYENCDYITVHVPLSKETKEMIDADSFSRMKEGVVLLNFSRDGLVREASLKEALENGKVRRYVTDFPNERVLSMKNTIVIPHLGASTKESEDNCAIMAVRALTDYAENGNIKNSVNFPDVDAGVCKSKGRIVILHKNIPKMIARFTKVFSEDNINIEELLGKSKGDYAVTVFDLDVSLEEYFLGEIRKTEGVLKVRKIK